MVARKSTSKGKCFEEQIHMINNGLKPLKEATTISCSSMPETTISIERSRKAAEKDEVTPAC